jgi:hypothetical protein
MQTITLTFNFDASKSPFALPSTLWQNIHDFQEFIHGTDTDTLQMIDSIVAQTQSVSDPYDGYFWGLWNASDQWESSVFSKISQIAQSVETFGTQTFPTVLPQLEGYPEKFYSGNYTNDDYGRFKSLVYNMWSNANFFDLSTQDVDFALKRMLHDLGDYPILSGMLDQVYDSLGDPLKDFVNRFRSKVNSDYFNLVKNDLQILQSTWDLMSSAIGNATVQINQMQNETPGQAFDLVDDFSVASVSWTSVGNDATTFLGTVTA